MRPTTSRSRSPSRALRAGTSQSAGLQRPVLAAHQVLLFAPFDALRSQHAAAVMAHIAPRSLLASARFEHMLGALECLMLGPLARQR